MRSYIILFATIESLTLLALVIFFSMILIPLGMSFKSVIIISLIVSILAALIISSKIIANYGNKIKNKSLKQMIEIAKEWYHCSNSLF